MASDFNATNVKTVRVLKTRLMGTLNENLEKHRKDFKDAMAGYRTALIVLLGRLSKAAAKGLEGIKETHEIYSEVTHLSHPRDYSESYEQAIALMEWETRDELELSINDFECYVRDNWNWKSSFKSTLSSYGCG